MTNTLSRPLNRPNAQARPTSCIFCSYIDHPTPWCNQELARRKMIHILRYACHFVLKNEAVAESPAFLDLQLEGNIYMTYLLHEASEYMLPRLSAAAYDQLLATARLPATVNAHLVVALAAGFLAFAHERQYSDLEWKHACHPTLLAFAHEIRNGNMQIDMMAAQTHAADLATLVRVSVPLHVRLAERIRCNPQVNPDLIFVRSYTDLGPVNLTVTYWDDLATQMISYTAVITM